MRTMFKLLLLLTVFLYGSLADSSEYDWNKVRDRDGIQVYTRSFWADDIKSFKSIITINARIDSILAVIMDLDACNDWIHRCKKSTLLLRKSFSECYHYQVQSFPFLAQNRDLILHSKIERSHQQGAIIIHMRAAPYFCHNKPFLCKKIGDTSQLIRIKHAHGFYLLVPLQDKVTRVTWTQHTDPEGDLPSWLVNYMIHEMPYRTFLGLRNKVLEKKYSNARLLYDSKGLMIGFDNNPLK